MAKQLHDERDKIEALRLLLEEGETQLSVARILETSQSAVSLWSSDEYILKIYSEDCKKRNVPFNLKETLLDVESRKHRSRKIRLEKKRKREKETVETPQHAIDDNGPTVIAPPTSMEDDTFSDDHFKDAEHNLSFKTVSDISFALESGSGDDNATKYAGISLDNLEVWREKAEKFEEPYFSAMKEINKRVAEAAIHTARSVREGQPGAAHRIRWLQINVPHWQLDLDDINTEEERASDLSDDVLREIIAADAARKKEDGGEG